ncbi:ABC transporter substrate-binding protein [Lysinibacter cavernae]|uniref:Peptide/nickel transport system substrate-binding protein n=1 Tax=Lysinibacter cavernae TaxID=1640652 RepID=A0A7X5R061_9MICO|nr:ABC transporter substrate-binding protein [Lysinibacter cavernae]NIH53171.1 peptide/nickel transport system substrate-binding protein [Lysinibacter cavernae]
MKFNTPRTAVSAAALGLAAAVILTGCAPEGSTPDNSASADALLIGTTDAIVSLDPAGAWDRGSFTPQNQIYQRLLGYEPGNVTPVPDAAESCEFTEPTVYTCIVKDGLTFSNGNELTAEDVVFSFNRVTTINLESGPAPLLANLDKVEEGDNNSVVFTLKVANDQTWPYVLTSMAAPIVDSEVFPADKLLEDSQVVGSGPYIIDAYEKGGLLSLKANPSYDGSAPVTENVVLKPYTDSSNLRLDIQNGAIDVAYRSLTSTDIGDLSKNDDLQVVQGPGGSVRFLTFNLNTQPGADDAQKLAIRQAAASLIDRDALADDVFNGTYTPAYSVVLDGQNGATQAFKERFGETPNAEQAKQILADAGVQTPVSLPIQYTSDHYGPDSEQEYGQIKSQLEADGLFTVDLQTTEWTSYVKRLNPETGYPAFQLGLFPDYPDPDNFLRVTYSTTGSSLGNGFSDPAVDALIEKQATEADPAARTATIEEIQALVADSASVIPLLQGQETVVAKKNVTGLEDTLDDTYKFRFAALGRS